MLAIGGINIVRKPFYALNKREVLLGVGILVWDRPCTGFMALSDAYGVNGLAAALSLSTIIQLLAYMLVVRRYVPGGLGLFALSKYFVIVALASLPSVGIGLLLMPYGQWESGLTLLNLCVLGGMGILGALKPMSLRVWY